MIPEALRQFFAAHAIGPCRMIVAVSGGGDSTALLVALRALEGFELVAGHVNHHLRGEESDGDEAFLRTLCADLGIELRVADGTLDPEGIRRHGVEGAARDVRLARLHELRVSADARYVVTAHQQNDQAETILMRLLASRKGSGIAGLRGIHPLRDDGVIRPLLGVSRRELEGFLAAHGIIPRADSSNDDLRFSRNRVRRVVRGLASEEVARIAAVAAEAWECWDLLERLLERLPVRATAEATTFDYLPSDPFLARALLCRHIRRLDSDVRDISADDLARLAASLPALTRVSVTKRLELVRRGGEVVLRRRQAATAAFETELTPERPAHAGRYLVRLARCRPVAEGENRLIRVGSGGSAAGRQRIQLPRGASPLFSVRNRRPGDRFQPLGLPFQKKLKDVLIDRKIAAELRDQIPLLVWSGEIVWIAGVAVSERFKVHHGEGDLYEVWLDDDHHEDDQLRTDC